MKHFILLDSNFIIAIINKEDIFHSDAIHIFKELRKLTDYIKIIIPPLGIYEIIVSLKIKGISEEAIKKHIMSLVCLEYVIVTSISEMSAFKHCRSEIIKPSQRYSLRTNDFLIASLAIDYQADILTYDAKVIDKIKPIYRKIYYCSSQGGRDDETKGYLEGLNWWIENFIK